jgi:hypothetical protein
MTTEVRNLRRRWAQWRPEVGPIAEDVVRTRDERSEMFTRGSTVRSTMEFLQNLLPAARIDETLNCLSATDRRTIKTVGDTDEIPYRVALALWRAVDVTLASSDPYWIDRSGSWAIERAGMRLYGGLIKKPSPIDFLSQHISLFHLYYRPGDMVLVEQGGGRAVMRLVGFAPADTLFCRRLGGGWVASLRIAGGKGVTSIHNRCTLEGDPFCEWELQWR